jgi:hypothetical protein
VFCLFIWLSAIPAVAQEVVINDKALTAEQIAEFKEIYGNEPQPGNYWYDTRSGLYGAAGYPAYGFMLAGHDYGTLRMDASNGNTGVVINGRQIELTEYTVWSQILGTWIQPGYYWLDEFGNAGYEGVPLALWNLYMAAQQNAYSGAAEGDNFWGSRFGAGNYDSGGQRGYVSVPGHGPVGYGF